MKLTIPAFLIAALAAFGVYSLAYEPPKASAPEKDSKSESSTASKSESSKESKPKKTLGKSKKMVDNAIYNKLSLEEKKVIDGKGTDRPFGKKYEEFKAQGEGTYICRKCNAPLYNSTHKFDSHCGWPSFDDEIEDAVTRNIDADGIRVEIMCKNCGGHLGHVFEGERFTAKNVRHCVNATSMQFVAKDKELPKVIKKDESEDSEDVASQRKDSKRDSEKQDNKTPNKSSGS